MKEGFKMYLSNIDKMKGKELGLVTGTYVASRVFYKDFCNSIRNFFGWELKSYTEMNEDAMDKAIDKMVEKAEERKANAIINIRIESTVLTNDAAVIIVSGTAIRMD